MKMTQFFSDQLEREVPATRKVLERVPEGHNDWKPHEKSMPMGYLAALVAGMPAWIEMMIRNDEFDIRPEGGNPSDYTPRQQGSRDDLLKLFDESVEKAKKALAETDEAHLDKTWRMLASGHKVSEQPRTVSIATGKPPSFLRRCVRWTSITFVPGSKS